MGIPVDELMSRVSERTRREYEVHFACEPPIAERLEWWLSKILAVLINSNMSKDGKPVDPQELIWNRWGDSTLEDVKTRREKLRAGLRALAG
jgi:hypothetical protein